MKLLTPGLLANAGTPPYDITQQAACGLGVIANINGMHDEDIARRTLRMLKLMEHRIAVDHTKTGDGAGVKFGIPLRWTREVMGITAEPGELAIGMHFTPRDTAHLWAYQQEFDRAAREENSHEPIIWRRVPIDRQVLGTKARDACPEVYQCFIRKNPLRTRKEFELDLFWIRKIAEYRLRERGITGHSTCSLSSYQMVWKLMATASQLPQAFLDLNFGPSRPVIDTAFGICHGRFATNTVPDATRAQPFDGAHNGEINAIQALRAFVRSLEQNLRLHSARLALYPILTPGGSDSQHFFETLEAVMRLSGRSFFHALRMMLPEPWEGQPNLDVAVRDFYRYHATMMAPWDGPATMICFDRNQIAMATDRTSFRPARVSLTSDGRFIAASEDGVAEVPDKLVTRKLQIAQGELIGVDLDTKNVIENGTVTVGLATKMKWPTMLRQSVHLVTPDHTADPNAFCRPKDGLALRGLIAMIGLPEEELEEIFYTGVRTGVAKLHSMGDDTGPPLTKRRPVSLFRYVKQAFAQVTNPPIDPIRESLGTCLTTFLGRQTSVLRPIADLDLGHIRELSDPLLDQQRVVALMEAQDAELSTWLDATYPASEGEQGLRNAIDRLRREAEAAVESGVVFLFISDQRIGKDRIMVPSLLAIGAVHEHLNKVGRRHVCSLIAVSSEVFDYHPFASLLGFGADAVWPWLAEAAIEEDETIRTVPPAKKSDEAKVLSVEVAKANWRKWMLTGLKKVMSKMGIAVFHSYASARLFDLIGIGRELQEIAFSGMPSPIGGIGVKDVHFTYEMFHREGAADNPQLVKSGTLKSGAKTPDVHLVNHPIVRAFTQMRNSTDPDEKRVAFGTLMRHVRQRSLGDPDTQRRPEPVAIRDLFKFRDRGAPFDLDRVAPPTRFARRFRSGAISHGAIGKESHLAVGIAMNELGGGSNSGEGGELDWRDKPFTRLSLQVIQPGVNWFGQWLPKVGDKGRSKGRQVASGRFGVQSVYLAGEYFDAEITENDDEIEIKMAQGAKPGEGGQLMGKKVTREIADNRFGRPGMTLISPPPHHDIYSIEDLAQLILDLKRASNYQKRICVKLVACSNLPGIGCGVARAGADIVQVSGGSGGGGTAAAGASDILNTGWPWELALPQLHWALVKEGLRSCVELRVDGGMLTGSDVVKAALMGAESYGFGTSVLNALGCIMARVCQEGTCPVGICANDPEYRAKFKGAPEHVIDYFYLVIGEVREILAAMGFTDLDEVIGRLDLLEEIPDRGDAPFVHTADLQQLLTPPGMDTSVVHHRTVIRNPLGIQTLSVDEMIIERAKEVIETGVGTVEVDVGVLTNAHLTVGAKLACYITIMRRDKEPLQPGQIIVRSRGVLGQSAGFTLVNGVRWFHKGGANDGIGKSLSGGEIIVCPDDEIGYDPETSAGAGSTIGYGAIAGNVYITGGARSRIGVLNSGATIVCGFLGQYPGEYMKRGKLMVLGQCGDYIGTGMQGGVIYVRGINPNRANQLAPGVVAIPLGETRLVEDYQKTLKHYRELTGSALAAELDDNWERTLGEAFVIVPEFDRAEVIGGAEGLAKEAVAV